MDKKALKALHGSINKWIKIVKGTGEDTGWQNCPLCLIFNNEDTDYERTCVGCPVMERTGKDGCQGTPYDEWADQTAESIGPRKASTPGLKEIAQRELAFLQSLLPSAEGP